jgi:hypothetical protein
MGDALGLQDLFFGTMAGAGIVLAGALYALLFGLGRLQSSRGMYIASLLFYALLAIAVGVLVNALSLHGFWLVVVAVMLIGYFFLPRMIWKLCVGTHAAEIATPHSRAEQ